MDGSGDANPNKGSAAKTAKIEATSTQSKTTVAGTPSLYTARDMELYSSMKVAIPGQKRKKAMYTEFAMCAPKTPSSTMVRLKSLAMV